MNKVITGLSHVNYYAFSLKPVIYLLFTTILYLDIMFFYLVLY